MSNGLKAASLVCFLLGGTSSISLQSALKSYINYLFAFLPQVFVLLLSFLVTLQQALSSGYINSVITTIEKRFEIPSSLSGLVASSYEIGNVITVIFVSYLGSRRHIPVWIGIGKLMWSYSFNERIAMWQGSWKFGYPKLLASVDSHFIHQKDSIRLRITYLTTKDVHCTCLLSALCLFTILHALLCKMNYLLSIWRRTLDFAGAVIMGIGSLIFMIPHFTAESHSSMTTRNSSHENICKTVSVRNDDMGGLGRLSSGLRFSLNHQNLRVSLAHEPCVSSCTWFGAKL